MKNVISGLMLLLVPISAQAKMPAENQRIYCRPPQGSYAVSITLNSTNAAEISEMKFVFGKVHETIPVSAQEVTVRRMGAYNGKWLEISFKASESQDQVKFRIAIPEIYQADYAGVWLYEGQIFDFPGITSDTTISGNGSGEMRPGDGFIDGLSCFAID